MSQQGHAPLESLCPAQAVLVRQGGVSPISESSTSHQDHHRHPPRMTAWQASAPCITSESPKHSQAMSASQPVRPGEFYLIEEG